MTLRQWFQRHHNRPLKIAAVFMLAVWTVFAIRSYLVIESKQQTYVKQTADLLSIAVYQQNRVLAESLLETLLSQGGATSAEVCAGEKQQIGTNTGHLSCQQPSPVYENLIISPIPGSSDLVLRARFNIISSFSSLFSGLGFALVLVFFGFYFIQTTQNRIKKDLFDPLLNKLLGTEELEIKELSDLRATIEEAKELEAQKAVNLAIQENNQQVAHDIRSPIESINELLKMVEIQNLTLKSALEKAVKRANSVSNSLLRSEKLLIEEKVESSFDVSLVIQDIAIEKRPLFFDGLIEVYAPKNIWVISRLSVESLSRILSNIVDNAILACHQVKKIKVSLLFGASDIEILVEDTGSGISPEVLSRIGEKGFSKREASSVIGSGRGVYSAKKALTEIGGKIEFRSSLGLGTVVSIKIPARLQDSFEEVDTILIDNDEVIRMMWKMFFEERGFRIREFSSIEGFLLLASQIPKDLPIFLDSDLGDGKKGQEYAPAIKKLGFRTLILATAFRDLPSRKFPGVDAIIGKSPQVGLDFIYKSELTGFEADSARA